MIQLGSSLSRIVTAIADAWSPTNPIKFAKLDIKYGFWQMAVGDSKAWNFCCVLLQPQQ